MIDCYAESRKYGVPVFHPQELSFTRDGLVHIWKKRFLTCFPTYKWDVLRALVCRTTNRVLHPISDLNHSPYGHKHNKAKLWINTFSSSADNISINNFRNHLSLNAPGQYLNQHSIYDLAENNLGGNNRFRVVFERLCLSLPVRQFFVRNFRYNKIFQL